jgi:substrate-binding family protein
MLIFAGFTSSRRGRLVAQIVTLVPEDISVVGFDDVPEAAYFIPPLTIVRPDFAAVAAASLDLLVAQIQSGRRLGDRRILTPTLVSRASVAPPPADRESAAGGSARRAFPSSSTLQSIRPGGPIRGCLSWSQPTAGCGRLLLC